MEIELDEDVDRQELSAYLQRKGAVRLLIVLNGGDRRYTELIEELNISTSTIYKRLEEGEEAGLITAGIRHDEDTKPKVYVPTAIGKAINNHMLGMHIPQVYWELKAREEQFDGLLDGLQEWILNEDEEFLRQVERHLDAEE